MTTESREDWAIRRRQGQGFTATELATIRIGFENDRPAAEIAREVGGSVRSIRRRFNVLRGKAIRAKKAARMEEAPKPPVPPKSRFYKSNFEL